MSTRSIISYLPLLMSDYAPLSFETIKLILENNGFTYACFDYGDFQIHVLPAGRRLELSEDNGVWHAYERNMPTQSLNTENQLYVVIDRNV